MISPRRRRAAVQGVVRKLPTSGSEVVYEAMPWSSPKGIRSANCWAYSVDSYNDTRRLKSQPGNVAARRRGFEDAHALERAQGRGSSRLTCGGLRQKVLDDLQDAVYVEDPDRPCRSGFYKIMLTVADGPDKDLRDYHAWKQHQHIVVDLKPGDTAAGLADRYRVPPGHVQLLGNGKAFVRDAGVFSHKLGFATGSLLEDSCGKPVFDPRRACRKVGRTDYKKVCDSFCVKSQRGVSV